MTNPNSPGGRWRRPRSGVDELVINGAVAASIVEAGPRAYVWTLAGDGATGAARSSYAAQRAVRRALRERVRPDAD